MTSPIDRLAARVADIVLATVREELARTAAPVSGAVVTKVQAGAGANGAPLVWVRIGDSEVPVAHGASYVPAVGDSVTVLRDGPKLVLNDKIIGGLPRG